MRAAPGASAPGRGTIEQRLLSALLTSPRVLLTGPMAPDGDSLGACLALQQLLQRREVDVRVAGTPSYRYAWMPGIEHLLDDEAVAAGHWDAVVVMDGDRHRLTPAVELAFAEAPLRGIVDHHASTRDDGYTHFWVDPCVGSTCEMLYQAMASWGEPLDGRIAECLYTGLIFDTGGFRYSNTRPSSHQMAAELLRTGIDPHRICLEVLMDRRASGLRLAGEVFSGARLALDGTLCIATISLEDQTRLGTVDGDIEGIVENLVQVKGVQVGALLIEHPDGIVKVSLRSRDRVDVADVARTLHPSGGGHTKAAGVRLRACMQDVCTRIEHAITAASS